jgi:putative MATE family efflux protein
VSTALWVVAWPVVVVGLLRSAYYMVDLWWVGQLGDVELTALSAGSFAWWIVLQVTGLAGTGVHALSAQAEGADDRSAIAGLLLQGAWVGVAMWAAIAAVVLLGAPLYFDLIGIEGEPAGPGIAWLRAAGVLAGSAVFAGLVDSVFRGLGRTDLALRVVSLGLVVNGLLDPLFILWAGLGLPGAAIATAVAELVAGAYGLVLLARLDVLPTWASPSWSAMRDITRIGAPIAVSGVVFSAVYVVLGRVISSFGAEEVAALGVGHRLEAIPYLTAVGFMVAASTLVGQHEGAGDRAAGTRSAAAAAALCVAICLVCAVPAIVWAPELYGLFSSDPTILEAGTTYFRIQALVWGFMALEVVYEGAFAGRGHTLPALVIGGVGTLLRIPLAVALAWYTPLGVDGVWIAIAVSTLLKGVVMAGWFHRS